jgi:hypothetical protein
MDIPAPDDRTLQAMAEAAAIFEKNAPLIEFAVRKAVEADRAMRPVLNVLGSRWYRRLVADQQRALAELAAVLPTAGGRRGLDQGERRRVADRLAPAADALAEDPEFQATLIEHALAFALDETEEQTGPSHVLGYVRHRTDVGRQLSPEALDLVEHTLDEIEAEGDDDTLTLPGNWVEFLENAEVTDAQRRRFARFVKYFLLCMFVVAFFKQFDLLDHVLIAQDIIMISNETSRKAVGVVFHEPEEPEQPEDGADED